MRGDRTIWIPAAALLLASCGNGAGAEFQAAARESRALEARTVLRQAFSVQESYRAWKDGYATTFDELAEAGWEGGPLREHHPPRIVRAEGDELCMEMEPLKADLWPQHVDQTGEVQRGPCP